MNFAHSGPYSGSPPLSGVPRAVGPLDGKIYARPEYKDGIMRKRLAFMVAALALLQVWSVVGQEDVQDILGLDSGRNVSVALNEFLDAENETINDTLNDTANESLNESLLDTNFSTTASQEDFLDQPVNQSLIDRNLTTTASQNAFLEEPFNKSLIDTSIAITSSMWAFLFDEPAEAPAPFFKKGQMMGSGANDSEAEQAPSFFKKGQMMGT
jgi:hypothetical protein